MRRGAEAKQADPFSLFHTRYSKAAVTDDACTQQRSRLKIVEGRGKRKNEIGPRDCEFGIAAIHRVSGEGRRVAQVLKSPPAVGTISVRAAQPGNADSRPWRKRV